jgi:hypothetical protein
MKPVLETVVRSSPAVCNPIPRLPRTPDHDARARAGTTERPHAGDADELEHTGRDRVANGQEREQWIDGNRVLDLDEGDAPDRGDEDERDQRHERKPRAESK